MRRFRAVVFHFLLCLLVLSCAAAPAGADSREGEHLWDVSTLSIEGVRLGMSADIFHVMYPDIPVRAVRAPDGRLVGYRARNKKGFTGGGMFQVSFTRDDLGRKAYAVALNRRVKIFREDLAPILAGFMDTYGEPDALCRNQLTDHQTWHAYWGVTVDSCEDAGKLPFDVPFMYLNLVSGKWTETLINLSDPELLQANVRAFEAAKPEPTAPAVPAP